MNRPEFGRRESPVMKWGFVIVTLYAGPIGAFLYVLACREPLPGSHADYVQRRWKQVVGSTMHCVAGDGIGILTAAAIFSSLGAPEWLNLLAEYGLGFAFGWTIFQSLFMRDMAGGSYLRSLRGTFLPEFVSMNGVMAGMVALSVPSSGLKRGMTTVPAGGAVRTAPARWPGMQMPTRAKAGPAIKASMVVVSLAVLAVGVTIADALGSLTLR